MTDRSDNDQLAQALLLRALRTGNGSRDSGRVATICFLAVAVALAIGVALFVSWYAADRKDRTEQLAPDFSAQLERARQNDEHAAIVTRHQALTADVNACHRRLESLRESLRIFARTAPWRAQLPDPLRSWIRRPLGTPLPENLRP